MPTSKNNRVTIKDVYDQIDKLREDIEKHYVSKVEFWPVKVIVYGLVSTTLLAVIGAVVAQVVNAR